MKLNARLAIRQRVVLFEASVALALRKAMDNRKTVFLLSMGRLTLLAEV